MSTESHSSDSETVQQTLIGEPVEEKAPEEIMGDASWEAFRERELKKYDLWEEYKDY